MEKPPEARIEAAPLAKKAFPKKSVSVQAPSIIVACVVVAIAALSIWYLIRPEPLLIQGEVDATRMDLAARVDGRVGEIPVDRTSRLVPSWCGSITRKRWLSGNRR